VETIKHARHGVKLLVVLNLAYDADEMVLFDPS
jgi:hypothetical protein